MHFFLNLVQKSTSFTKNYLINQFSKMFYTLILVFYLYISEEWCPFVQGVLLRNYFCKWRKENKKLACARLCVSVHDSKWSRKTSRGRSRRWRLKSRPRPRRRRKTPRRGRSASHLRLFHPLFLVWLCRLQQRKTNGPHGSSTLSWYFILQSRYQDPIGSSVVSVM